MIKLSENHDNIKYIEISGIALDPIIIFSK